MVGEERGEGVISQQVVRSHTCYSTRCENQCRVPLVAWGHCWEILTAQFDQNIQTSQLWANKIIVYVNMSLLLTSAHSR